MSWCSRFYAINTSETGKWIKPQSGEWTISRVCYPRKLRIASDFGRIPTHLQLNNWAPMALGDVVRTMEDGLLSSIACISLHQPWHTFVGSLWVNYLHCMPIWRCVLRPVNESFVREMSEKLVETCSNWNLSVVNLAHCVNLVGVVIKFSQV